MELSSNAALSSGRPGRPRKMTAEERKQLRLKSKAEASRAAFSLNQGLLVNKLSNEVLLKIFIDAAQTWSPHDDNPSRWIRLTHVCRHWRHLALQSPSLWTEVNIHNQDFLEACLERSGTHLPLSVRWTTAHWDDSSFISDVFVYPHNLRIRSITVEADLLTLEKLFRFFDDDDSETTLALPHNLVSLQLSLRSDDNAESYSTCGVDVDCLDDAQCPLHTLKLRGVSISYSSSLFSSHLRTLHISEIGATYSPSVSRLLRALRNCTFLEDLSLDRMGPVPDRQESDDDTLVEETQLSHLHTFHYRHYASPSLASGLGSLLAELVMPHTTHIALDVLNDHDQDEVDPEPINASIQRYLHLTSAHLHVFHDITNVEFQNVDGFYVRGWNTTTLNVGEQDPPTSSGISSAPIFQFALPDEDGENIEITSSVLVLFMESFPFSPVLRTLCLSLSFDDFEISAAEWAKLFDVLHVKAPSLRQLTIKANLRRDWALEHSTTQAATIIQVIVDVLQMLSDERQPLPLLQKINVHDVPDSIRDVLEIITAIDNCAQSRRHHGPLHVVINGFESQLPLYEYEVKPTS